MRSDSQLQILVLGSAAGGGSPQWNCRCEVCQQVRAGAEGTSPRTQTSLAVSADGARWVLINAAPDLGKQISDNPALHPASGKRHSPIEAVVLTGGEVDQVAGLLTMRERESFGLYASSSVHQMLEESAIFGVLGKDLVPRRALVSGESTELVDGAGVPLGIRIEAFEVAGKVPLYCEVAGEEPALGVVTQDTLALRIEGGGARHFFFVPGCAAVTPELRARLDQAPLVFFDGTLWQSDELVAGGLGQKTGARMGHLSMSGPAGTIEQLKGLQIARKVFIHINNSNPVLLAHSPERAKVEREGWEVAFDGMTIRI